MSPRLVIRPSAGALVHLTHARIANIARGIERLRMWGARSSGWTSTPTGRYSRRNPPRAGVAVVLGSEGEGLGWLPTGDACDLLLGAKPPDARPCRLV